jgi:proton-translocating NADH-quinone oxidoreductase chain N
MLMATTGTLIGMVCARDLFNLWIWFEAMVMASFLLVSFYGKRPASLDASVKYLVQSAIGSFLILLGIALVLAQTGTLALDHLQQGTLSPILLAAGALFLIGFGIKSALVPMHTWLPDAYAESPSTITALLSGAVTVSGLIALARVLAPLAGAVLSWGLLLMVFGAINMLVGNLLALRQQDVKRLLAYSSISHIGYIVLGLGIGIYTGQAGAAQGGLFHALTTGAMETLAFLAVGALLFSLGKAEDRDRPLTIAGLQGLLHRYPLPSFALVLAVLSLGGIPPLAGFMSKWQIFVSGFAIEDPLVRSLIVFAGLNALLSMAYYLPVTISLCRHDTIETAPTRLVLPSLMRLPLIILIAIILIVGIWPDLARGLTGAASAALINAFHLGGGL